MNSYSKYLVFKSTIEDLFGQEVWYALKESNDLTIWKKYCSKILDAILVSISDTIKIHDEEWKIEIIEKIKEGKKSINAQKSIDEILAALSAALINISFLQIGFMPRRKGDASKYPLRSGQWKFDRYRTAIYLQTPEQRHIYFIESLLKKIGLKEVNGLLNEHHLEKSELTFEKWYKENGYT
jgi:hypothetical protein